VRLAVTIRSATILLIITNRQAVQPDEPAGSLTVASDDAVTNICHQLWKKYDLVAFRCRCTDDIIPGPIGRNGMPEISESFAIAILK